VKDIYSPLDIDEEWDNMAPMVDAPVMGGAEGATAVAVKPDEGTDMNAMMPAKEEATSTLPPVAESNAMNTDTMPATPPLVNEGLKEDTASQDAAFEVANADMGMNNMAANTDDKLNINEINPDATAAAPSAEMAMPSTDEMPKADTKEATATPVPVIDMNAATSEMKDSGDGGIKVGESFTPEEKPAEDRFEGMEAEEKEEAPKEEKPEDSKEEPAAAELPVTPADKVVSQFGSSSKNEMKFDMSEVNEAMDSFEKESDMQDNKFIKMLEEAKGRALEGINHEIDSVQNKLNDLNGQLDKIGSKRDMVQGDLDKLMDEKSRIESSL
jgi:cytochrome c556